MTTAGGGGGGVRGRKRRNASVAVAPPVDMAALVLLGVLVLLLVPSWENTATAFTPLLWPHPTTSSLPLSSPTALSGVRSAIQRGFSKVSRPFRRTNTGPSPTTHAGVIADEDDDNNNNTSNSNEKNGEFISLYNMDYANRGIAVLNRVGEDKIDQLAKDTDDDDGHDHHHHHHHDRMIAEAFHQYTPSTMFEQGDDTNPQQPHKVETALSSSESPLSIEQQQYPAPVLEQEAVEQGQTQPETVIAVVEQERSKVERRRLDLQSNEPLYVLPPQPESSSLSKLEAEFRDMLSTLSNYSRRDLYALHDPRMRTLICGVAASGNDRSVYRAFEILFQDLLPLRVAGRLVYKRLLAFLEKSIRERDQHIAHVVEATGLDASAVEEARIVFFEVASKLNQEAHLTPEQLTATRIFHSVHGQLDFESPTALIQRLDRHGKRKIGLEDFLIGIHECAEDHCDIDENDCFALNVVHNILDEIDSLENPVELETKTSRVIAREAKELQYVMRYDEMVEIFKGWKNQVPGGLWKDDKKGRKWEIVQGCFVGAENQQVVDALRVVYVEYAALRVAAEFILSTAASLLKVKAEVPR